jgi:hypothetical protein
VHVGNYFVQCLRFLGKGEQGVFQGVAQAVDVIDVVIAHFASQQFAQLGIGFAQDLDGLGDRVGFLGLVVRRALGRRVTGENRLTAEAGEAGEDKQAKEFVHWRTPVQVKGCKCRPCGLHEVLKSIQNRSRR